MAAVSHGVRHNDDPEAGAAADSSPGHSAVQVVKGASGDAGNGSTIEAVSPDGAKAPPRAAGTEDFIEILPRQYLVATFYNSIAVQVGVAILIGSNFLMNMLEKQIDPGGSKYVPFFAGLDLMFNIAFFLELLINIYAHWLRPFWASSWNVFDFVVVSIGVINVLKLPLPPAFNLLRLMRAFRVFRLFKRVKSLNKIIVSITKAVPGVMNAFLILTIVMSIYAILSVELFQNVGQGCKESNFTKHGYESPRKFCYGNEYFGSFSRSMYSFFQVLTGESWSEMIARPAIWFWSEDEPFLAVSCALFFVSFVLVTSFVLMNVVVAVLLDKMASETGEDEAPADESAVADAGAPADAPVAEQTPLSTQELEAYRRFSKLQQALKTIVFRQEETKSSFVRTKADMDSMKEQLGTLAKAVERLPPLRASL